MNDMRKYMDLIEGSNKYDEFREMNSGRFGDTALNIHGEEIENSVYLGGATLAYEEGDGVTITAMQPLGGPNLTMHLTHEAFSVLKKTL